VGRSTEIADYLRLLYARVGVPHCPAFPCARELEVSKSFDSGPLHAQTGTNAAASGADCARARAGQCGTPTRHRADEGSPAILVTVPTVDLGDWTAAGCSIAMGRTEPSIRSTSGLASCRETASRMR